MLRRRSRRGGTLREQAALTAKRVYIGGGTHGMTGGTLHRYSLFRNEQSDLTLKALHLMFVIVTNTAPVTARCTVGATTRCCRRCGRGGRARRIEQDAQFNISTKREDLVMIVPMEA